MDQNELHAILAGLGLSQAEAARLLAVLWGKKGPEIIGTQDGYSRLRHPGLHGLNETRLPLSLSPNYRYKSVTFRMKIAVTLTVKHRSRSP